MKGCVIGGIVLIVVVAVVVCNALFVRRAEESLLKELEALPPVPDPTTTPADVAALRERLDGLEGILGLSVGYVTLDKAQETLRTLEVWAAAGEAEEYAVGIALLRELLEDIGRLERLSVKNLM